jgi:hypothetical protein
MTAQVRATARRAVRSANGAVTSFEPLRFGKRATDEERIVLFEIDGTPYTMPAVVDTGTALTLEIQLLGVETERRKALFLIQQLCGMDAYRALVNDSTFTIGDLLKLGQILAEHAFGSLEEESGN